MTVKLERHPVVVCPCMREQRKAAKQDEEGPEARIALHPTGDGDRVGTCPQCGAVYSISEAMLVRAGQPLPPLKRDETTAPPPPGDPPPPPVND